MARTSVRSQFALDDALGVAPLISAPLRAVSETQSTQHRDGLLAQRGSAGARSWRREEVTNCVLVNFLLRVLGRYVTAGRPL